MTNATNVTTTTSSNETTTSSPVLSLLLLSEEVETLGAAADQFFVLTMGALVLLMQAGFALIEAGTVRAKNATSILIKNISDLCFGKEGERE